MNKSRIEWIDIAKGLGMILVILGHCVFFGGKIHNAIFAFHMPFFFVLSGIVFENKDKGILILKKFKSLIIPYMGFCIIGGGCSILISDWRSEISLKNIIKDVYLGTPENINVSSIWFLLCLFWVTIFFNTILKIENKKLKYIMLSFIVICGFMYAQYKEKVMLPLYRMPFDLDVALIGVFFLSIGYFFKSRWYQKEATKIELGKIAMFFLIFNILVFYNGRVNLHELKFNNVIIYLLESLIGSYILITFGKILEKFRNNILIKLVSWIGKNNIYILGLQALMIRIYLIVINNLYHHTFGLYRLEGKYQFIGFAFVLVSSIGITYMYKLVLNLVKGKKKVE